MAAILEVDLADVEAIPDFLFLVRQKREKI
jgi:hypothetical protein